MQQNQLKYVSYKPKRVVRIVLGGKNYALADAFDTAFTIFHDLNTILGGNWDLPMIADSLSLFKVIVHASTTTEKPLMIDIRDARQAYEKFEITHLWVHSADNITDGLTEPGKCASLLRVLTTACLDT